jgi:hypothetical protein
MRTTSITSHGTRSLALGTRPALALVASLLTIGGCYEGAPDGEELEGFGDIEEASDVEEEPTDAGHAPGALPAMCAPTMHVFPVADAHNIGYDPTCDDYNCDISCPDAHANSDWNGPAGHHGIDIFAYRGAPLVAVTSGTIKKVGVAVKADGTLSKTSGIRVRLRDDCGWEYYYGHLDLAVVHEGQHVEAGELLGYMGNTGTSGVHTHFNVSPDGGYNNDINPFDLLKATSPTACGGGDVPLPPAEPEPQPQPEGCDTSVLAPDQALYANESVSSCNGLYTLVMQDDGNVVLYGDGTALWNSQTAGKPGSAVVMQSDGNFVLYDGAGTPLWHAGTHGHPGAMLRVEEDGNMIIWNGWTPIWSAR